MMVIIPESYIGSVLYIILHAESYVDSEDTPKLYKIGCVDSATSTYYFHAETTRSI